MATDLELKLRLIADFKAAIAALQQVRSGLTGLGDADTGAAETASGIDAVTAATEQATQQLEALSAATAETGGVADETAADGANLGDSLNNAATIADSASFSFIDLKKAIAAMGLVAIARQFIDLNREFEATQKAMTAVLGSAEAAIEGLADIDALANRLGQSASALKSQFVDLAAATRGTALEGQATRDVFAAVVGAMSALGKSSAQTSQALNAISQMASKGVVSAEEMKEQLGEALPGAMQALSDATGVTVADLTRMMEAGKLLSVDILPALTKSLTDIYNTNTRIDGLGASVERLGNAFEGIFTGLGQAGLSAPLQWLTDVFADGIKGTTATIIGLGQAFGVTAAAGVDTFKGLLPALGDELTSVGGVLRATGKFAVDGGRDWDSYKTALKAALDQGSAPADRATAGWNRYKDALAGVWRQAKVTLGIIDTQTPTVTTSARSLQELAAEAVKAGAEYLNLREAATAAAAAVKAQGEATMAAANASAARLTLTGRETDALLAQAKVAAAAAVAAQQDAAAKQRLATLDQQALDQMRQLLVDLEASKTLRGAEIEQIQERIKATQQIIEKSQAAVDQTQAEADAAAQLAVTNETLYEKNRLLAETYGDQSGKIDEYRRALDGVHSTLEISAVALDGSITRTVQYGETVAGVRDEINRLTEVEGEGLRAEQELADVTKQLDENQRRLADTTALSTPVLAKLGAENESLTTRHRALEQAIKAGADATLQITELQKQEAALIYKLADAYADLVKNREQDLDAAERATRTVQSEGQLRAVALRNLEAEAQVRGDVAGAIYIADQAARDEILTIKELLATKNQEVIAAQALTTAKQQEADADGTRTLAEQEAIAASEEAALAKRAEAEAIAETVRHKVKEYNASLDAANAAKKEAETKRLLAADVKDLSAEERTKARMLKADAAEAKAAANEANAETERQAGLLASVAVSWEQVMTAAGRASVATGEYADVARDAYQAAYDLSIAEAGRVTSMEASVRLINQATAAGVSAASAAAAHARAVDDLAARQDELSQALDDGTIGLADYLAGLQRAEGAARTLGREDLRDLRSAIADAKAKMQDFTDSARDGLSALKQEWAELNGDQGEVENLQYQEKKLDLEQQMTAAARDGNREALAVLKEQAALLYRIHQQKLANLAAEQQAAAQQAATTSDAAATSDRPATPAPTAPITDTVGMAQAPTTTSIINHHYSHTINLGGVLDVNDPVSLSTLGLKLKPVLATLERRGA
jgi:tape measure domain-containing protein